MAKGVSAPDWSAVDMLVRMAQKDFQLAFISAWKPEDGKVSFPPVRLADTAGAYGFGRQELLCRFRQDGRKEGDWLLCVWTEPGEGIRPSPLSFAFLTEFADFMGRSHSQPAVLLVSGGKARLLDLVHGDTRRLGAFGRGTLAEFFAALGREGFEPAGAREPRKPGDLADFSLSQRITGELCRRELRLCVEGGFSLYRHLSDKVDEASPWPWRTKAERPAPAKPKRRRFEPGEAVLVQLPQPDGTFKTLAGTVVEDWNGQVRVCTGKGENRKLGTFSADCVYPQDTTWATGGDGADKDCIIPE